MKDISSKAIVQIYSERIKNYRIDCSLTQKDLAEKSGVSLRSIQNFEHGKDIQLTNLIKILKALDLIDNLSMLVPDISKKPSVYLETSKTRERVRKSNKPEKIVFKWGDET